MTINTLQHSAEHLGPCRRRLLKTLMEKEDVLVTSMSSFPTVIVISSPEHEVLRVSYCDSAVSDVRHATCVVCRQLFTLCTLWRPYFQSDNHETWSECLS